MFNCDLLLSIFSFCQIVRTVTAIPGAGWSHRRNVTIKADCAASRVQSSVNQLQVRHGFTRTVNTWNFKFI